MQPWWIGQESLSTPSKITLHEPTNNYNARECVNNSSVFSGGLPFTDLDTFGGVDGTWDHQIYKMDTFWSLSEVIWGQIVKAMVDFM